MHVRASMHLMELLLARAVAGGFGALPWRAALATGARLGDALHAAGVRRRVAEDNVARVVPGWDAAERARIVRDHYREVGRIASEYARLPELVHAAPGEVCEVRGAEHLEAAAARGRGVILMTGHFGNFELLGAALGRIHPVDFVVRPLSNARVDAWLTGRRAAAGVGTLRADEGVRDIYRALRAGRWVAMLADQDARRTGVFVPFLGRPASTPVGPARIALATGAPIVMGFGVRGADGRHDLEIEPPHDPGERGAGAAAGEAVERLTAWHTARLEAWVRRAPHQWFWLHRRWKTQPPAA